MKAGELDITPMLEKLGKLSEIAGTEMKTLIRQEAALFVWNSGDVPGIINITPPFSARDKRGQSALFAARSKIDRDLAAVFQPVQIKGQRTISQVFGRKLKHPVKVQTKEIHPDVEAIANYRWQRKNERRRKLMSRGQVAAYYVDKSKLEIVKRERYALIGLACSCWHVAAQQCSPPLKLTGVPPWIKRHSNSFAAGSITTDEHSIRIDLSSSLAYNAALEMSEKVVRVLGYRQRALESRLPYALKAAARKANLAA